MSEEEKTKLETLIELLYTDRLSQYGKRELVNYIDNQQKEIKSLTDENNFLKEMYRGTTEYKAIKKKVEELG